MGTGLSLPRETVIVGKTNRNAPNLYRFHDLPDHLYPYETRKSVKIKFPDIELALALEAFNSIVECKLDLEPTSQRLTRDEVEIFKTILNPAKTLQSALISSNDTKELKLEISADDKQIYLCRSYLVELNEIVCKHRAITILQICCNYLRYLPYGLGQLRHLKMLIVSRNRIVEIPEEIGLCKEMRELDLSNNLIRTLPKSLVCLKRLNTLQLANNLLTELPTFLGKVHSLKYLNLSNNRIRSIPLEIIKLPFLLSLNCTGCTLNIRNRKIFEIKGKMTLIETAARNVIRKNLPIRRNSSESLFDYLLGVQECSFCGGPFFEYYVNVEDFHIFESEAYPTHYKMCSLHYMQHEDRLSTLFERSLPTFPIQIFEEDLPSVCELFESHSYDESILQQIMEKAQGAEMVPLIWLAGYNRTKHRPRTATTLFHLDQGNPNIFDQIFDER